MSSALLTKKHCFGGNVVDTDHHFLFFVLLGSCLAQTVAKSIQQQRSFESFVTKTHNAAFAIYFNTVVKRGTRLVWKHTTFCMLTLCAQESSNSLSVHCLWRLHWTLCVSLPLLSFSLCLCCSLILFSLALIQLCTGLVFVMDAFDYYSDNIGYWQWDNIHHFILLFLLLCWKWSATVKFYNTEKLLNQKRNGSVFCKSYKSSQIILWLS